MKQQFQNTERILWVDICRGVGIILVILGHCSTPFNKYIYGFHMPLFFVLTGYLYKRDENLFLFIKKISKKYLVPYFILCFINLCINTLVKIFIEKENPEIVHYIKGIIYSRGTTEWMPHCSPLWFLTAIFVALFIFSIVNTFVGNNLIICSIVMVVICPLISWSLDYLNFVKMPWNIDSALMAVAFIKLGRLLKEESLFTFRTPIIFGFVLLLIGFFLIKCNPIEIVSFDDNIYGNLLIMMLGAMAVTIGLIIVIQRISQRFRYEYLAFLGRHTIFIMGFDYFSGGVAKIILDLFGIANWLTIFIVKLFILSIGIILWEKLINLIPNEKIQQMLRY